MISEIFRLDAVINEYKAVIEAKEDERKTLLELYHEVIVTDQVRFDTLIGKHNEILDNRLGLNQEVRERAVEPRKPIGHNRAQLVDWEKKRREEYWSERIKQVEAGDAKGKQPRTKANQ